VSLFDRFKKPSPAPPVNEPPSKDAIVPIVLDAPSMARQESLAGKRLARRHLCADLWTVYATTPPPKETWLTEERMLALAMSASELHALALANLEARLPGVQRHGDGGAELLACGGGFETSLLLFHETWEAIAEDISGDVVACVPARDRVIFTGSAVPGGVERVRAAAQKIVETHPEPVSATLLRWTGEGWDVWP